MLVGDVVGEKCGEDDALCKAVAQKVADTLGDELTGAVSVEDEERDAHALVLALRVGDAVGGGVRDADVTAVIVAVRETAAEPVPVAPPLAVASRSVTVARGLALPRALSQTVGERVDNTVGDAPTVSVEEPPVLTVGAAEPLARIVDSGVPLGEEEPSRVALDTPLRLLRAVVLAQRLAEPLALTRAVALAHALTLEVRLMRAVPLSPTDAVDGGVPVTEAVALAKPVLERVVHSVAADVGVPWLVIVASAVTAEDAVTESDDDTVPLALEDAGGDRDALGDPDAVAPTLGERGAVAVLRGDADALVLDVEPIVVVGEAETRGLLVADCGAEGERDWRGDADALNDVRADELSEAQPDELRDARLLADSLVVEEPERVVEAHALARAVRLAQLVAPPDGDTASESLVRAEAEASLLALAPVPGDGVIEFDPD